MLSEESAEGYVWYVVNLSMKERSYVLVSTCVYRKTVSGRLYEELVIYWGKVGTSWMKVAEVGERLHCNPF